MAEALSETLHAEYQRMRRIYRILMIVLMTFPVYTYGPLLWKDGSYAGRWDFVADVEPRLAQCRSVGFILQLCELNFPDRQNNRMVRLEYLLVGTDWNDCITDIVRSSTGHFTGMMAINGPALFNRAGAFLVLIMIAFVCERLLLFVTHRALVRKAAAGSRLPAARVRETTLLSRDRRDHFS